MSLGGKLVFLIGSRISGTLVGAAVVTFQIVLLFKNFGILWTEDILFWYNHYFLHLNKLEPLVAFLVDIEHLSSGG